MCRPGQAVRRRCPSVRLGLHSARLEMGGWAALTEEEYIPRLPKAVRSPPRPAWGGLLARVPATKRFSSYNQLNLAQGGNDPIYVPASQGLPSGPFIMPECSQYDS